MTKSRSPSRDYYTGRYQEQGDRWSHRPATSLIREVVRQRLHEIIRGAEPVRLLDIGCGCMTVTSPIVKEFQNICAVGIDWTLDTIMKAYPVFESEITSIPRISMIGADFMEFTHIPRFHVAVDLGMFHHLVPCDWPQYTERLRSIMCDHGHVLLYSFHPNDPHWGREETGGHIRQGYYCHYHNMDSIRNTFGITFTEIREITRLQSFEHVTAIYHIRLRPAL